MRDEGKILAHGKCILLGEHSVVRGGPALVFPLRSRKLNLSWRPARPGAGLVSAPGEFHSPLTLALPALAKQSGLPHGLGDWEIRVESEIPTRAGLGSSAALSVALVRFASEAGAHFPDTFSAALALENLFHGRSSGIDVAASLSDGPIRFRRGEGPAPLELRWQPKLYLADTGLRSATKECVEKVERLGDATLDLRMTAAVERAEKALASTDKAAGCRALASAINEGAEVFALWSLVPEEVRRKMQTVREAGALAVKPTGSGDGGYLLSLWDCDPKAEVARGLGLIPLSADF